MRLELNQDPLFDSRNYESKRASRYRRHLVGLFLGGSTLVAFPFGVFVAVWFSLVSRSLIPLAVVAGLIGLLPLVVFSGRGGSPLRAIFYLLMFAVPIAYLYTARDILRNFASIGIVLLVSPVMQLTVASVTRDFYRGWKGSMRLQVFRDRMVLHDGGVLGGRPNVVSREDIEQVVLVARRDEDVPDTVSIALKDGKRRYLGERLKDEMDALRDILNRNWSETVKVERRE